MTKVLVLYYSSYGHIETMAKAVAEGAKSVEGADVTIKRVPELMPEEVAKNAGVKLDQEAPIAEPGELADYDAIIFGTPTRFGNMASQMRNFLDQTGGLWAEGKLIGKVGSVFASTATQHGGQETTITSFHTTLLHHGMVIVGLPYSAPGLQEMEEISGGTPYGATTLAKGDGSRQPSASMAPPSSPAPAMRSSTGSRLWSAAYLSRKDTPKKSTTSPTLTTGFPPVNQPQTADAAARARAARLSVRPSDLSARVSSAGRDRTPAPRTRPGPSRPTSSRASEGDPGETSSEKANSASFPANSPGAVSRAASS